MERETFSKFRGWFYCKQPEDQYLNPYAFLSFSLWIGTGIIWTNIMHSEHFRKQKPCQFNSLFFHWSILREQSTRWARQEYSSLCSPSLWAECMTIVQNPRSTTPQEFQAFHSLLQKTEEWIKLHRTSQLFQNLWDKIVVQNITLHKQKKKIQPSAVPQSNCAVIGASCVTAHF